MNIELPPYWLYKILIRGDYLLTGLTKFQPMGKFLKKMTKNHKMKKSKKRKSLRKILKIMRKSEKSKKSGKKRKQKWNRMLLRICFYDWVVTEREKTA